MIALTAVGAAYALALLCVAGRLYVLGCAHGLRRAISNTYHTPQGRPPSESQHSPSHAIVKAPKPVLNWPRDN